MAADYTADERDLLRAVRHLVRADREMRKRLSSAMAVNPTDLQALRHVIRAFEESREAEGLESGDGEVGDPESVQSVPAPVGMTPRRLAERLGVTTAATTTLVDRLVASGHLVRRPHPADRRSVVLVPTDQTRQMMYAHLADMHARMKEIAAAVPEAARPALLQFLTALTSEMERGRLDVGGPS